MRRIVLAIGAAALLAAGTSASASAAQDPPPCDPGPCIQDVIKDKINDLQVPTVEQVIWAVKCIGDSLGGNACVGP